ncbi:SUMF1/EgtB/PvdO family nonheme iron enzyme, partial [Acidobacteria bacterium AH-259-G07]|nr:SUMF1/EgtB/PvdO family nonheme iron enzyme [Acidobacteria bacterium AH-259-G07]
VRRPRIAFPALLVLLVASILGYWLLNRAAQRRWARAEAIPEIISLIDEANFAAAFALARKAEQYIPNDPLLTDIWPRMSGDLSIVTDPPGTDVFFKATSEVGSDWEHLGQSPIEEVRFPLGVFRWKVQKEGYETIERLSRADTIQLILSEKKSIPPGMVPVPAGEVGGIGLRLVAGGSQTENITIEGFLIDKYEVTNRQFKTFVDSGGYQSQEYWKHSFVKDGRVLTWDQAIAEFRDATGRSGPATWELQTYPDGEDGYPVAGISWYEATAYAEFAGKSLPTIYHWYRAAGTEYGPIIIPFSNFGGKGPASVASHDAISPFGTYDMAGNVREWCWNESRGLRYILGGAWSDPIYMFSFSDVRSPFDRSRSNGFRCVRYLERGGASEATVRPVDLLLRDYDQEEPVSEAVFEIYKQQFLYDRTDLNAVVESRDESSKQWTLEKITFDGAYGNERVIAYLLLPKSAAPPYQTVIYFPGSGAIGRQSNEAVFERFGFLVKTGRALMCPVYKGTYERRDGLTLTWPDTTHRYAEDLMKWVKDFRRSIDYLVTRQDIDVDRLAYLGSSWGGRMGAVIPAVEDRLRVSVLHLGGLASGVALPEVDQINYVSRVTIPVLMLNGRYDSIEPLETAQKSMFRLLGTSEADKRHVVYETGHSLPRNESIKETLDWLDRYLGPVQ